MKIIRVIFLLLHLGILFLLFGTILNAYIPPKVFPWINILSLGFPVLIIGYVLLTFFWIFSWKKRSFVFLFLLLFFLNPIKRWVNFSFPSKETPNLKIITFNAKAGSFGKDKIKKYIDNEHPDVVFFQETGDGDYYFSDLKRVTKISIISLHTKHKVIAQKEIITGDYSYFNAHSDQTDIEIRGKVYRFINIYLQPFRFEKSMVKLDGNGKSDERKVKDVVKRLIPTFKIHQEQVAIIKKAIENSPYPVIVAGDLNSVPNSYEYYHLSKDLTDPFIKVGKGSGTSFHDYKYPLRLDYIFTSKNITPVRYKVDYSTKLSDHYPVIAEFQLN